MNDLIIKIPAVIFALVLLSSIFMALKTGKVAGGGHFQNIYYRNQKNKNSSFWFIVILQIVIVLALIKYIIYG